MGHGNRRRGRHFLFYDPVGMKALILIRAWFRLLRVALHLLNGALIVAIAFPWAKSHHRRRLRQRWSTDLLGMLNVRHQVSGNAWPAGGLLVSNHVSWLDIFVINAIYTPCFVCKDDVKRWPLIGWLCKRNDVIFIDRSSRNDAHRVSTAIAAKLASGELVAVFPEGTSTEGSVVLPFRSALMQAAIDSRCGTLPLAIRYFNAAGLRTAAPAYSGAISLLDSLLAITSEPSVMADIHTLRPLGFNGMTRRQLADLSRTIISARVECGESRGTPLPQGDAVLRPAVTYP